MNDCYDWPFYNFCLRLTGSYTVLAKVKNRLCENRCQEVKTGNLPKKITLPEVFKGASPCLIMAK